MVTIDNIRDAATRLEGVAVRTPLLENPVLNDRVGGRVLMKLECLQATGSFKMRGAYNRISRLTAEERTHGVLAWSSGNHAQGVARAAELMGTPACILMPQDAPKSKVAGAKSFGAEVVFYDRYSEDREEIGRAIAKERGMIIVPPYDNEFIIAGQGTCGLEIAEQAKAIGTGVDQLLVCAGGGGLTAGCAVAFASEMPKAQVYSVEPEGYDDIAQSLAKGERVKVDASRKSIADALLPPTPGALTWPILKAHLSRGLVVSEDEIRAGVRYAYEELNLKVEPGGVVTLAAVLAGKIETKDKVTAVTLSGGNVDADVFCGLIA